MAGNAAWQQRIGARIIYVSDHTGSARFDAKVRKKLEDRYGPRTRITVIEDGGARYEYFRREVLAVTPFVVVYLLGAKPLPRQANGG